MNQSIENKVFFFHICLIITKSSRCYRVYAYMCIHYFPLYPGAGSGADSGTGDPHMLVHVPGLDLPVCFDYMGKNGDVVSMIEDRTLSR